MLLVRLVQEAKDRENRKCNIAKRQSTFCFANCTENCLPGKSAKTCPAPSTKIFLFPAYPNHFYNSRRPAPSQGALAIVTDVERDAVDADGAFDERRLRRTAKSCGPDASTPASSWRMHFPPMTVTKKPDHRGEHEGNR
jgi:hypothetical protein